MDVEGEGISFRQWEREALARDHEASAAFETEVEPQGAASGPSIRGNIELRLSRRHRAPTGEVGEVVENLALHGCGGRPWVARSRAAHRWSAVRSDSPGDENTRSHVRIRSATGSERFAGMMLIAGGQRCPLRLYRTTGRMGEPPARDGDRKSTRLNSSHLVISYAVFCLKKKK